LNRIRSLSTQADFEAFADIVIDAYPALFERSERSRHRLKESLMEVAEEAPAVSFWGLFRSLDSEERLLGGMRLFDFQMNFLHTHIPVGGVGQVAVALEYRRKHVAKELMRFYLRHYRERGTPLAVLYPFRPDFYRKMGFGYGTKMSRYRLDPEALPESNEGIHLRRLGKQDREALRACYTHYARRTHGMIHKTEHELDQLFEHEERRVVGYEEEGELRGYMVFTFEEDETFLINDLHVREFVYETREALAALLGYLRTQHDQVRRIVVRTQDPSFHHLFDDPRDGSDALISPVYHATNLQGVGLMYRVIDVPRIFRLLEERDFGGQTCRLNLIIDDTLLPENAGATILGFEGGHVRLLNHGLCDVTVQMDVGSFSALLAGTVTFERLYTYSLAEISDLAYADTVSHIFAVAQKPVCVTAF
jgi:predicted acetyltransferase